MPVGLGGRDGLQVRVCNSDRFPAGLRFPDGLPVGLGAPDRFSDGGAPDGLTAGLGAPGGAAAAAAPAAPAGPAGPGAPAAPVAPAAPGLPAGLDVPDGLEDDPTELAFVFAMMKAVSTPVEWKTVPTTGLKWHSPLL